MTIAVATTQTGFNSTSDNVSSANMTPFANSVDAIFNNILNGIQAADKLLFTSPATLTINAGVLAAPTQALHYVSAETGVSDTLDTIGVSNNRFIVLKATAGHTIILSNSGNMTTLDGRNITLTGNTIVLAFCLGSQWGLIGAVGILSNFSATVDPTNYEDSDDGYEVGSPWVNTLTDRGFTLVDATIGNAIWKRTTPWKNSFRIRGSGASIIGIGVADPTTANSPSSANDATAPFVALPSTAVSGNLGGWIATTFTQIRLSHDPTIEFYVKTDANIASVRFWLGLTSIALTNSDTAAGSFVGFRFSTVTGDGGWLPVARDGATQSNGVAIGTVATSTIYKLRIRIISGTPMAFFSVNDGGEQAYGTNLPAISTDLGVVCRVIPQAAAIKILNFSYCEVGW